MRIFEKLFCKHKWKSHAKDRVTVTKFGVFIDRFNGGFNSTLDREVLICNICGKIKIIEY